jgi:hypothetical protein
MGDYASRARDGGELMNAATLGSKAAQKRRTPKRGRPAQRAVHACVLECGGVPPLFKGDENKL